MSHTAADIARAMSTAERWAASDPDRATKAETEALLNLIPLGDESAIAALISQFGSRLAFGTAGLRGELGPGPGRMNRVVVQQTSAGFAEFLLARAEAGETSTPPSIVIGFDARTNSELFARDAAEIFAGYGLRTILLPGPVPTPVTAFAVRELQASAGVMVTASHNPPRDNGYKVYLGDADAGSQITAPVDSEIAALIEQVAARDLATLPRSADYEAVGQDVVHAYIAATASAVQGPTESRTPDQTSEAPFTVVYTAMHGVGSDVTQRVFESAGLPRLVPVPEQDLPDPKFPTVAFPNPEEPGALDLAFRTAREHSANLTIAHDPDADRLAVAIPDSREEAGYRRLTGNQLGLILGWQAAERFVREGGRDGALACTIVSSPALGHVARDYGLRYEETLSGFKWVSRVPGLVFGFEEALGYLTRPEIVRDKDGISAAADLVRLALNLHENGQTLADHLDAATMRFGCFASTQVTVRLGSATEVAVLAERIRADLPTTFAGVPVTQTTDLLIPGNSAVPANVLRFDLEDGSRVMIRPSGTEPKLKLYLDTFSDTGDLQARTAQAERCLQELEAAVRELVAS